MLATQTMDGDLRVWSVPKPPHQEPPNIIRVLQRADIQHPGPCWFAWSKNGRIVQHAEGETRSWDVRTKKVSWETIPTVDGVTGIANFGPTATLFTLSRGHQVQQYDITPNSRLHQVASALHAPANTPPTPPTTLEERKRPYAPTSKTPALQVFTDTSESSADEGAALSPMQKIAMEMDSLDALESEIRDKVMPLSPTSSRTSSVSSKSSGGRRRGRKYLYDKPDSSRASSTGYDGTEFSYGAPSSQLSQRQGHESMSIRSVSSFTSQSRPRGSALRKEIMRSPQESKSTSAMELFPNTRERLQGVPFRTPHYGSVARTPELLQREMLSVIFGWNDTARALVREELRAAKPGSASGVLLSKWLGDMGADDMASMIGSETMTSSDWMLLALSSIGVDSQKKVGEAFVQRLLEKGDIHPAVAILLGLGENNDAIEVYVSQGYWMESVLLTCLTCPSDWGRVSYLIRKWGESAVQQGQAELAVRCFSCTSIETSEPWFSPRAQDAVYAAQQEKFTQPLSAGGMTSPPISPPSRSGSGRLTAKNASLKLITTFGDKAAPQESEEPTTTMQALGVTPIAQSALSPGGLDAWQQHKARNGRDPSSARTATPGGFSRRKRLPSKTDIERAKQETANLTTPITAARDFAPPSARPGSRRTSSLSSVPEPRTALKPTIHKDRLDPGDGVRSADHLPSPAMGVFSRLRAESNGRNTSQERKPEGLAVNVVDTRYTDNLSPGPSTQNSQYTTSTGPPTGGSLKSGKGRAVDDYVSSIEAARDGAREKRAQSKRRGDSRPRDDSRPGRGTSRAREPSEGRAKNDVRYIRPAKRSPSSPIPMSPEEIAQASLSNKVEPATTDDESFYKVTSPVDSHKSASFSLRSTRSDGKVERRRPSGEPPADDTVAPLNVRSRGASRQRSEDALRLNAEGGRGRSQQRKESSGESSPSLPLQAPPSVEQDDTSSDGRRNRPRAGSRTEEDLQSRRAKSRDRRDRSTSRKPMTPNDADLGAFAFEVSNLSIPEDRAVDAGSPIATDGAVPRPRGLSRKEMAAKELEDRRLSLARRPSAPAIPMPGELHGGRPPLGQRTNSNTDIGESPVSTMPPPLIPRSQTADPEQMSRYGKITGMSTPSAPIGLPATPRAMRHPRYMSTDPNEREGTPPVPEIPDNISALSSMGSSLSQVTGSALGSNLSQSSSSALSSALPQYSQLESEDGAVSLLPSTVFGQKGPQAPARASTAPPENPPGVHPAYKSTLPHSNRRLSHVRKISPPDASQVSKVSGSGGSVASIDEALAGSTASSNEQQIVFLPDDIDGPPVLPELQHLAGPPPPPPPPSMYGQQGNGSGTINIAMDEGTPVDVPSTLPSASYPQPMERATTSSPQHRRGRNSVSETFGSRFRGFGDRMRSTSRNRVVTKSPQQESAYKASPYETVLPPLPSQHQRKDSTNRAKSPYEQAMAAQNSGNQEHIPPPPPPPPGPPVAGMEGKIHETTIPPSTLPPSRTGSAQASGYRNPKEVRANMPPNTLQQGVYYPQGGFL